MTFWKQCCLFIKVVEMEGNGKPIMGWKSVSVWLKGWLHKQCRFYLITVYHSSAFSFGVERWFPSSSSPHPQIKCTWKAISTAFGKTIALLVFLLTLLDIACKVSCICCSLQYPSGTCNPDGSDHMLLQFLAMLHEIIHRPWGKTCNVFLSTRYGTYPFQAL